MCRVDVRLRPVRDDDVDQMAADYCDPDLVGEHNWGGAERDPVEIAKELREGLELEGLLGERMGQMIVELADGTRIGDVSWRTERWGPSDQSTCPAIGITLLPDHRGKGYGTVAQRLLIDHLFENFDTNRIQSDTAADNPAEQRALVKAGMREEGVVRGAEFRNGTYHDHILYGILRSDWMEDRSAGK
jgi:aminoglycoside 6'-N-acetyltransferase